MPTYKASLTGVGDINNVYIYLEVLPTPEYPAPVPVFLKPKGNGKKSWTNDSISIVVHDQLDYELRIHAFKGTGWSFKLTNKANNREVISLEGKTGENPDVGLNMSIKRGHVNPDGEPNEIRGV